MIFAFVARERMQGMTLDAVRVSLSSMFVPGQAYVALSRVRSMEGLEIVDWDLNCLIPNPAVVGFYQRVADNEDPDGGAPALTSSLSPAGGAATGSAGFAFRDEDADDGGTCVDGEDEDDGTHPEWKAYQVLRDAHAAAATLNVDVTRKFSAPPRSTAPAPKNAVPVRYSPWQKTSAAV
jgi:hypothetical protein